MLGMLTKSVATIPSPRSSQSELSLCKASRLKLSPHEVASCRSAPIEKAHAGFPLSLRTLPVIPGMTITISRMPSNIGSFLQRLHSKISRECWRLESTLLTPLVQVFCGHHKDSCLCQCLARRVPDEERLRMREREC